MKLNPPVIDGTIPAFYNIKQLKVPFSMNPSVGLNEIEGFHLKLKDIYSNQYLAQVQSNEYEDNIIYFKLPDNINLVYGKSYKIQIAYLNNGEVGYYSTVGVAKYTHQPQISVKNLISGELNLHQYKYQGLYLNEDISEKVYQYQFNLFNVQQNLIETSDWLLHNSSNDTENDSSYDEYEFKYDLNPTDLYYVEYKIKTVNNLEVSTAFYSIQSQEILLPSVNVSVLCSLDKDNGCVNLSLTGKDKYEFVSGFFKILKKNSKDNIWEEVNNFSLVKEQPIKWSQSDYIVEQGMTYTYALQQYNSNGIYSTKHKSEPITVDFEDIFLFDGEYQLKIKYNPQINSIKDTILEQKLDTIGSKYPFIFRNGKVKYKEFPISGLITYFMDDGQLFSKKEYEYSTDLTGENIKAERDFKFDVFEWLNNGKPKLFRSPTEGNYLVRLLNISLAPENEIGRMLHTFSATAYEVDNIEYNTLLKYGIIKMPILSNRVLKIKKLIDVNVFDNENILENHLAQSLKISHLKQNELIKIEFIDGEEEIFMIDSSGYEVNLGKQITSVSFVGENIEEKKIHYGLIEYKYYDELQNNFNAISKLKLYTYPSIQISGTSSGLDVFKKFSNIKESISNINFVNSCSLKKIHFIYANPEDKSMNRFRTDEDYTKPFEENGIKLLKGHLYLIQNAWDDYAEQSQYVYTQDEINYDSFSIAFYSSNIYVNGYVFDMRYNTEKVFDNFEKINSLIISAGVNIDLSMSLIEKVYNIENSLNKTALEAAEKELKDFIYRTENDWISEENWTEQSLNIYSNQLKFYKVQYDIAKQDYLLGLEAVLKLQEENDEY